MNYVLVWRFCVDVILNRYLLQMVFYFYRHTRLLVVVICIVTICI